MPDDLVKVEAIRDLNIPGEKTKKIGAPLELPEATVKILEAGKNPSVKRVKVAGIEIGITEPVAPAAGVNTKVLIENKQGGELK